jgi:hypothetical protein
MKFMCILHIQKNKNGIVLFEIVILIYSIDYKVVFRAALYLKISNTKSVSLFCDSREYSLVSKLPHTGAGQAGSDSNRPTT